MVSYLLQAVWKKDAALLVKAASQKLLSQNALFRGAIASESTVVGIYTKKALSLSDCRVALVVGTIFGC